MYILRSDLIYVNVWYLAQGTVQLQRVDPVDQSLYGRNNIQLAQVLGAHTSDQKQVAVSNLKLEFNSRPARKFWTFWRIFTDVKTSVWALTESLALIIIKSVKLSPYYY